jgi:hypothetical protein
MRSIAHRRSIIKRAKYHFATHGQKVAYISTTLMGTHINYELKMGLKKFIGTVE